MRQQYVTANLPSASFFRAQRQRLATLNRWLPPHLDNRRVFENAWRLGLLPRPSPDFTIEGYFPPALMLAFRTYQMRALPRPFRLCAKLSLKVNISAFPMGAGLICLWRTLGSFYRLKRVSVSGTHDHLMVASRSISSTALVKAACIGA